MAYNPYKTIGIGVAFSPNLDANLHEAKRLAHMLDTQLVVFHVGPESKDKRERINAILYNNGAATITYTLHFVQGKPIDAILNCIKEYKIDLLLLGALTQERFIKHYLGSIARKITRQATCSVLMMINPSINRLPCQHVVVNGLEDEHTATTINAAFHMASALGSGQLTIVEEISQEEVKIKVDDDDSLRRANLLKEKIKRQQEERVQKIVDDVPVKWKAHLNVETQPIFGKSGYTIGHYAQIARADLLVMNAPSKSRFIDRFFPHDIEFILNDLPTDVLIVR